MKKAIVFTLVLIGLTFSISGIAQPPPPPTDPKEYAPGNAPVGAPVGNGSIMLIALAALYAARKTFSAKSES